MNDDIDKAELYDHMLAVARANGFNSITEAIAVAKRKPIVQFEATARRYSTHGAKSYGLWEESGHVSVETPGDDRSPLELGQRYRVTIEKI